MDRVFLDANVLFSAAYRATSGLVRLWDLANVELIASAYAANEASRNLADEDQLNRLRSLLGKMSMVDEPSDGIEIPPEVNLPEKDLPILLAAVQARATHLLTGDKSHFGALFEKTIEGVMVQTPSAYLAARSTAPKS